MKFSKMTWGRLLDLVQPEVNPYNTPTPKNYISTKHVDSALFAIRKLSQLKAAILFPASKMYSLGYPPVQNLAPMSYASTVMWYDVASEGK